MNIRSISISLLLTCAVSLSGCRAQGRETPPAVSLPKDAVILHGEGRGYTGVISVNVTVSSGAILAIELEENGDGSLGQEVYDKLSPAMIAANSPDVDGVSRATVSSDGFREAVRNALEHAG